MSAAGDRAALAECIKAGIRSKDGRGQWRAVSAAVVAMTGCKGPGIGLAQDCALAAVQVGANLGRMIRAAGFKP